MCNRMKPQEESNPMAYDMTLRDQFAMAALTGMLANNTLIKAIMKDHGTTVLGPWFEENLYVYADSMLKARNKGLI